MIPPDRYETLAEIRERMDRIDREVIALLASRVACVRAAAKFKTTSDAVAAPDRVRAVLETRREWGASEGLDRDFVERLYREITTYCVAEEKKHWDATRGHG